ncbi:MAG TPA: MBL fold metallo-hydrolase [Candidatus Andersenbacteria bacterium]|nr:MBL fold metallo-hydrolase [Candidatus Andersenbacteria bacterium]
MTPTILALGTGAADSVKYFQTSFFIEDEKTDLLIDTGGGSGILAQCDRFGVSVATIQNIFITHKHIDHIFGIFWILRFRGAAIHSGQAPSLTIYASLANIALIKQVSALFLKEKVLALFDSKILFIAIDENSETDINDWTVQFFKIQSKKEEQWGCKITFPGNKTLTFTGDEPYTKAITPYCTDTDYFFHDAYCLEKDRDVFTPHDISHSTAKEASIYAQQLNAKNLILFHTEDKATFGKRKELYTAEAQQEYSGNIFVPDDGDVIEIQ